MSDARKDFKLGFLAKCAAEGLTPDEILERVQIAEAELTKAASVLGTGLEKVYDAGKGVASTMYGLGMPLALAGPPIAGAMAGYGLAKATDIDNTDVGDIQDQEVVDEYRRQAAHLKRQTAARQYQAARRSGGRRALI